jgi:hypothetical protein
MEIKTAIAGTALIPGSSTVNISVGDEGMTFSVIVTNHVSYEEKKVLAWDELRALLANSETSHRLVASKIDKMGSGALEPGPFQAGQVIFARYLQGFFESERNRMKRPVLFA